jgi:O-methyltransferase involved in polyketide biosynthesis
MATIAKVLAVKAAICYREPSFESILPDASRNWYQRIVSVLPGFWGFFGRTILQRQKFRSLIVWLNEILNPGDWAHIVYRKARMAQIIDDCITQGADGIINLGCGFDTNTPASEVKILHVDRESVLNIRDKMRTRYPEMVNEQIDEEILTDLDSVGDLIQRFAHKYDLKNMIIQCEGFLEYLDDRAVADLLAKLSQSISVRFLVCSQFDFSQLGAFRARLQYGAISLLGESVGKKRTQSDWQHVFEPISDLEIKLHESDKMKSLHAQFPAACIRIYEFR